MCEELPCHMCGEITDLECEDCYQPVCEECCTPFTLHNQFQGTRCVDCNDTVQMVEADRCQELEIKEEMLREKREKRNAAARRRYNSTEQREKRRLAKIELGKQRRERALKRMEKVGNILKGFGF